MQTGAIRFELEGMDKLRAKLLKAGDRAVPVLSKEMYLFAEDIMADSKENYVPVATGTLKAAGIAGKNKHVMLPRNEGTGVIVEMGYGGAAAYYALSVHENPRAGKTGGVSPSGKAYSRTKKGKPLWARVGQWKYLEYPFLKWKPKYAGRLTVKLREVFGV